MCTYVMASNSPVYDGSDLPKADIVEEAPSSPPGSVEVCQDPWIG